MARDISINNINEDIIKSVSKKVITSTSLGNIPFTKLIFGIQAGKFGFSIEDGSKFISVRCSDKLTVYINNSQAEYKKTFVISDVSLEKLTTQSVVESYKKYCINTIYTIIKTWIDTAEKDTPNLGEWNVYKY